MESVPVFYYFYESLVGLSVLGSLSLIYLILSNTRTSVKHNGRMKLALAIAICQLCYEVGVFMSRYVNPVNVNSNCSYTGPQPRLFGFFSSLLIASSIMENIFCIIMGLNFFAFIYYLQSKIVYDFRDKILVYYTLYTFFAVSIALTYELWYWLAVHMYTHYNFHVFCYFRITLLMINICLYFLAVGWKQYYLPNDLENFDLDSNQKVTASNLLHSYYIPVLLWYPLLEACCRAPLLFYQLHFGCDFISNPTHNIGGFILQIIVAISYPAASWGCYCIFLYLDQPNCRFETFIDRLYFGSFLRDLLIQRPVNFLRWLYSQPPRELSIYEPIENVEDDPDVEAMITFQMFVNGQAQEEGVPLMVAPNPITAVPPIGSDVTTVETASIFISVPSVALSLISETSTHSSDDNIAPPPPQPQLNAV